MRPSPPAIHMREQHLKPNSTPVLLHNYLEEPFTFYWDKEPYTLEAGEKIKMFKWLAVHGAVKMAERYFAINLTNPKAKDPKQRGFYTRHDDAFKNKVLEAIIESKSDVKNVQSETANAIESMNEEQVEPKQKKREIELETADDDVMEGCQECRATGPRHKPTCSKFKKHETDEAQEARLRKTTAAE